MRFLIFILAAFGALTANAQQSMYFPTLSETPAGTTRCLSDLVTGDKRCWILNSVTAKDISISSSKLKTSKIRVVEAGVSPGDQKAATFMIAIEWEAESRGTLSFSGPKGKLYAAGALVPAGSGTFKINFFADDSPSEQFDRRIAFGTDSRNELHELTLAWLNEVLGPYLASRLAAESLSHLR